MKLWRKESQEPWLPPSTPLCLGTVALSSCWRVSISGASFIKMASVLGLGLKPGPEDSLSGNQARWGVFCPSRARC